MLWDGEIDDDISYRKLVAKLRARFGSSEVHERFAVELRSRRRRSGETIAELHADIRRLMALAYPDTAHSKLGQVIARDHFITALNDREFELKVRDRDPVDLEAAVKASIRVETYLKAYDRDETPDVGRKTTKYHNDDIYSDTKNELRLKKNFKREDDRVRQVTHNENKVPTRVEDPFVTRLSAQMEKIQRGQDELSKEIGRLKLLAERSRSLATPSGAAVVETRDFYPINDDQTREKSYAGKTNVRTCFNCNEPGHFARNCPHINVTYGGSNTSRLGPRMEPHINTEVRPNSVKGMSGGESDNCCFLRVTINAAETFALLDSGSDVSIIPSHMVNINNIRPTNRNLLAANGTGIALLGEADVMATIGDERVMISGYVSDHMCDVILGIDFLSANNAKWDFKAGIIEIRGTSHVLRVQPNKKDWCRRVVLDHDIVLPPHSESIVSGKVMFQRLNQSGNDCLWATCTNQPLSGVNVAQVLIPQRITDIPVRILNMNSESVSMNKGSLMAELTPVSICNDIEVGNRAIDGVDRNEAITKIVEGMDVSVSIDDKKKFLELLNEFSDVFAFGDNEIGRTTVTRHHIITGNAQPIRQRMRRQPPAYQEIIKNHVETLQKQGIITPAQSPWAANIVLVKKKDNSYRCCIDYRGLNDVTRKDAYALPHTDVCLDALGGSAWFSTLDMKASYHQIEMESDDADKTAFICREGMFKYLTMPFGLCNAGATFQRLIDMVLSGLTYEICLAYVDDIIIYSKTVDEHRERLRIVFQRLRDAGLKLKPSKCFLLQKSVGFLGHIVSEEGIEANPDKICAIVQWPIPLCVRDVRAWLGLTGYYRRFVKDYAQIVQPLTELLSPSKPFIWSQEAQTSFESLKNALTSPPILVMPTIGDTFTLDTDASDKSIGAVLSQNQNGIERVIAFASKTLSKSERNYSVTRRELLAIIYYLKYFRHYLVNVRFRVRTDHSALLWLRRTPEPTGQQARWIEIMENYNFFVEHRPGRAHGNADAMSRIPAESTSDVDRSGEESEHLPEREIYGKLSDSCPPQTLRVGQVREVTESKETTRKREMNDSFYRDIEVEQKKDPDLRVLLDVMGEGRNKPPWDAILPWSSVSKSLWSQWDRLKTINGVLYRQFVCCKTQTTRNQVVIPRSMCEQVVRLIHEGVGVSHLGRTKTEGAVGQRAYWVGWTSDVRRILKTCETCVRYKRGVAVQRTPLKPIICGEAWEVVSVDITGPHPTSHDGFVWILTLQDHFSKWVEAYPLRRHTAPIVARTLFDKVFTRFGCPLQILSDQGPEFESALFKELCRLMQVDKIRTSPYHPSGNGMLERYHRCLNSLLAKVVSANQKDWSDHLQTVVAAYRATVHEAIKMTPNRAFLGREVRLPIDLVLGTTPDGYKDENILSEVVEGIAQRMRSDGVFVREQLGRAASTMKTRYDARIKSAFTFNVGDRVWYFYPRRYVKLSPKWQNMYVGPYIITQILDPCNIAIQKNLRSPIIVVHRDKLRPCYATESQNSGIIRGAEYDGSSRSGENTKERDQGKADVDHQSYRKGGVDRPQRNVQVPKRYTDYVLKMSHCDMSVQRPEWRSWRSSRRFRCPECRGVFSGMSAVYRHQRRFHKGEVGQPEMTSDREELVDAPGPVATTEGDAQLEVGGQASAMVPLMMRQTKLVTMTITDSENRAKAFDRAIGMIVRRSGIVPVSASECTACLRIEFPDEPIQMLEFASEGILVVLRAVKGGDTGVIDHTGVGSRVNQDTGVSGDKSIMSVSNLREQTPPRSGKLILSPTEFRSDRSQLVNIKKSATDAPPVVQISTLGYGLDLSDAELFEEFIDSAILQIDPPGTTGFPTAGDTDIDDFAPAVEDVGTKTAELSAVEGMGNIKVDDTRVVELSTAGCITVVTGLAAVSSAASQASSVEVRHARVAGSPAVRISESFAVKSVVCSTYDVNKSTSNPIVLLPEEDSRMKRFAVAAEVEALLIRTRSEQVTGVDSGDLMGKAETTYDVKVHDHLGSIQWSTVSTWLPVGSSGPRVIDVYQKERLISPAGFLKRAAVLQKSLVKKSKLD
jgi:transposase InsO family protein